MARISSVLARADKSELPGSAMTWPERSDVERHSVLWL